MSPTAEDMGVQGTEDISEQCGIEKRTRIMKPEFLCFNSSSITSCGVLGKFLKLSVPKFQHLSSGINSLGGVYVP